MPAYNEAENIQDVVTAWHPIVERVSPSSRLVVMDDGSSDATPDILKRLLNTFPQLIVLEHENRGHGATVRELYRYALDAGADFVFQTDSDGQTNPAEFSQLWDGRHGANLSIGNRDVRQDGVSRLIVTRVLRLVVLLCFHVRIHDANSPFRLMDSASLARVLPFVPEGYNLSNVLVSVLYRKLGYRVAEASITFKPRQRGVNSINLHSISVIGLRALASFIALNRSIDAAITREGRDSR